MSPIKIAPDHAGDVNGAKAADALAVQEQSYSMPTTVGNDVSRWDGVPAELKALPQWVLWKSVVREGKPTKIPYQTNGAEAKSTDRATWADFGTVLQACAAGGYDGIGIVFAADDPYCGIDLDDSLEDGGTLLPWAAEIVSHFPGAYIERSPSKRGVKLWIKGRKPEGSKCRTNYQAGEVEIYDRARYFTVTGCSVGASPQTVPDHQESLNWLIGLLWPVTASATSATQPPTPSIATPDDQIIIDKIIRDPKHAALWSGNTSPYNGDDSAADLALVGLIAFYVGPSDAGRIDRIFRQSSLCREKWTAREDYRRRTIERALSGKVDFYDWDRQAANAHRTLPPPPLRKSPAAIPDSRPTEGVGLVKLGERDPATGRLVLSPRKTQPTADAFIRDFYAHRDGETTSRKLHAHAGQLMEWRGNRYVLVEDGAMRQKLLPWLHQALRYFTNRQTGAVELTDFESNPGTVNAALDSIRALTHLSADVTPAAWLNHSDINPDPRELLPFPSGILHVPTRKVLTPTPALFNVNAIDFEYDANAEPAERWTQFLEQLWGDDLESVQLLQEWMGYCLVADTSQQKMLLLVGPKRSGKGTIGRVLRRLVGEGNVCSPTTSGLAGTFGLQGLIGKSLAIVSDARFSGPNVLIVVERLLNISGEDSISIERKFLGDVTLKLPTRLMFLSNEIPRANDASGALAGRFLVLRLDRSFYGQEDTGLESALVAELPGILLWAIEGLKRLRERGRFVQPQSAADALREMEDLASPTGAFVRDWCVVGSCERIDVSDLYDAFAEWCRQEGRTSTAYKQLFGRDLAAAVPSITVRRGSDNVRFYQGIGLNESARRLMLSIRMRHMPTPPPPPARQFQVELP